jgi:hypothetical protein
MRESLWAWWAKARKRVERERERERERETERERERERGRERERERERLTEGQPTTTKDTSQPKHATRTGDTLTHDAQSVGV